MTDIQQARDVLAKWREHVDDQPWSVYLGDSVDVGSRDSGGAWGVYVGNGFARLIVGTAGNPELLDAIDEVLRVSLSLNSISPAVDFVAHRFTRAILAADERMSA